MRASPGRRETWFDGAADGVGRGPGDSLGLTSGSLGLTTTQGEAGGAPLASPARSESSRVTEREIRVGIVGADVNGSWAKHSHVPAVIGLPDLKLTAVATLDEKSARESAEAFGADRWFSDPFAMIRDELIDVVTVAVKVPRTPRARSRRTECRKGCLLRGTARA